jgi:hypothetical protein
MGRSMLLPFESCSPLTMAKRPRYFPVGPHFLRLISLLLLLGLALAACCDFRSTIDDATGPKAYRPAVVGNPIFVLEVYEYSNFDLAHAQLGQRFISMRNGDLKSIGQNYARSIILKAQTNTSLEVTADNGHKAQGKVGPTRQLKITDLCQSNDDGSYTIDGQMSCIVTGIVVRAPGN